MNREKLIAVIKDELARQSDAGLHRGMGGLYLYDDAGVMDPNHEPGLGIDGVISLGDLADAILQASKGDDQPPSAMEKIHEIEERAAAEGWEFGV